MLTIHILSGGRYQAEFNGETSHIAQYDEPLLAFNESILVLSPYTTGRDYRAFNIGSELKDITINNIKH